MSRGFALGGSSSGSVIRVVDALWSSSGIPCAAAPRPGSGRAVAATASRQSVMLTISMAIAPSGHVLTQAGACPSERRPWHMSHLPTTPRSALYCGTPYEQFHVQYWQPMQVSALWSTMPVVGSFAYASTGQPVMHVGSRQWLHDIERNERAVCGYQPPSISPTRRQLIAA